MAARTLEVRHVYGANPCTGIKLELKPGKVVWFRREGTTQPPVDPHHVLNPGSGFKRSSRGACKGMRS